jgi:hypothetical protein
VAPRAERAVTGAPAGDFQLDHAVAREGGVQQIKLRQEVILEPIRHNRGVPWPAADRDGPTPRHSAVANAADVREVAIAVEVAHRVGDRRFAGSAGDEQSRVPLQQQCLVAQGQAAAREHQRRNRHLVQPVEQFAQQVVLAEGR